MNFYRQKISLFLLLLGFALSLYGFLLNESQVKPSFFEIRKVLSPTPVSPLGKEEADAVTTPVILSEIASGEAEEELEEDEGILVTEVIDGDTIKLETGETVRYIGIDTPETVDPRRPVQCFGMEAARENRRLVLEKRIEMEKDVSETDRYGRLLRYVYVDGLFVNEHLVREGFAYSYSYPPDVGYQELFVEAQNEARDNGRGLWSACN